MLLDVRLDRGSIPFRGLVATRAGDGYFPFCPDVLVRLLRRGSYMTRARTTAAMRVDTTRHQRTCWRA